jgi:hypothetical protein
MRFESLQGVSFALGIWKIADDVKRMTMAPAELAGTE